MPTQLAIDLSHLRVRAVEIDGTAKAPKIKSFTAADVVPLPPAEEGGAPQVRFGEALRDLAAQRRLTKDPAHVALSSLDCTFREIELPFTSPDQIDKVVKFEAESHLQLVEIDSVVVSYQLLDSDGRGGSRLLIAACPKETVRTALADLATIGVDPLAADLHLTSLWGGLRATGCFEAPPPPAADAPPEMASRGETVVVLECDDDATHLLVVRGETLLAARALRFGVTAQAVALLPAGAREDAGREAGAKGEGDETLVVVDDLGGDEGKGGRRAARDFFGRLQRELTRTLFRLGPGAGEPARILLCGTALRDPGFAAQVESALHLPVEAARPFDRIDHSLDAETLELANAEGIAALGLALRMAGAAGVSRIEFRQEELRYARRFDQVKVALASAAIVALVCVALICIERIKRHDKLLRDLIAATTAVLGEHQQRAATTELYDKVNSYELEPIEAMRRARDGLRGIKRDYEDELGRSTTIPRLPGGLDYLNAVVGSIAAQMKAIGRLQLTSLDIDLVKEKPTLKLAGILNAPENVDALVRALRACPAVANVQEPATSGTKDGRLSISNLEIDLVPNWDARAKAKGDGT